MISSLQLCNQKKICRIQRPVRWASLEYCPNCGTPIVRDNFFCHNCGNSLRTCPSCDFRFPTDVPLDARYCPNCGQRLFWIKWDIGDTLKVFLFSILLLIPFILLSSLFFSSFMMSQVLASYRPLPHFVDEGNMDMYRL